jgi:hypothetical protein
MLLNPFDWMMIRVDWRRGRGGGVWFVKGMGIDVLFVIEIEC